MTTSPSFSSTFGAVTSKATREGVVEGGKWRAKFLVSLWKVVTRRTASRQRPAPPAASRGTGRDTQRGGPIMPSPDVFPVAVITWELFSNLLFCFAFSVSP
ncbi:hypothetical protein E2C01_063906 [Portunus trituberculatus]|uniref:Uncharacterized protein n=1 Tax=Portunus trituberculatus TaxID=210409 RepID=A0A5B7HIC2_PORTR|nr:hypothetical protein [Portunus trituberculatus]